VSKIAITRLIIKYDDRPDEAFEGQILEFFMELGFEKTASGYDVMQGMTDIELERV
jgi:hypothetical protein